jgi:mannosyltransferase
LAVGLGLIALLGAIVGLGQPLWLDELHTDWVIADGWSELSSRAQQGNQTLLYFGGLKCLTQMLPIGQDWLLRLPSVLAWATTVASLTWMLLRWQPQTLDGRTAGSSPIQQLAVVLWICCILLDPWQYFYAIEARPYGTAQLVNLWAWYAVTKVIESKQRSGQWWVLWVLFASVQIHLHITTGLAVAFQCAVLLAVAWWKKRDRWQCIVSQTLVAANGLWLIYGSQAVWQRRQQWSKFAGDASVESLLELMPIKILLLPVLVIGAVAWSIHKLRSRTQQTQASEQTQASQQTLTRWSEPAVWAIASIGPLLAAWLLTRFEIAPVFHYRFVIVAALPLFLFAGSLWLHQKSWIAKWATVIVVFSWMNYSHGPWSPMQQRRWTQERREDWRSAMEFVREKSSENSSALWCYAGLIESVGLSLPIDKGMEQYLSFPVQGRYRLRFEASSDGDSNSAKGLVASRPLWSQQILQSARNGQDAPMESKDINCWIVYRGPSKRFAIDLKTAGLEADIQPGSLRQFGNISVVWLRQK